MKKLHRAVKVRIYPNREQSQKLSQVMGCARWWWNYALNLCNQTYKETGKGLGRTALNSVLPKLKKDEETEWLNECYSQVLQSTTLNLTKAFKNFFEKRAKYPRFKSYHGRQSAQYPQNCLLVENGLKVPQVGVIKASIHRLFPGQLKTVTISKNPTGKYYASLLFDTKQEEPEVVIPGKVIGIDLGIKDFAVTNNGEKSSKYDNPKHLAKHEKNLARKQKKLARCVKDSNNTLKAKRLVGRVCERISNARQDFLHKLSRKIVNDNQVVVIENLNVKGTNVFIFNREPFYNDKLTAKGQRIKQKGFPIKNRFISRGMVRNRKLAKAVSDVGWGMFTNFLDYKLKEKGGKLLEIDRWFPSSKTCSSCLYQINEMPLDVREWTCPSCGTHHDRDENAAKNIRAEGIRQLSVLGTRTAASGGDVRPRSGRKSVLRQSPIEVKQLQGS